MEIRMLMQNYENQDKEIQEKIQEIDEIKQRKLLQWALKGCVGGGTVGAGGGGFSSAVANAVATNPNRRKRKIRPGTATTKTIVLDGGKRMTIPDMNRTSNVEIRKRMKMLKRGHAKLR